MSEIFTKNKLNKIFLLLILFSAIQFALASELSNYSGPGDNKDGYNSKDYETNSLSLSDRKGKSADLIKFVTLKQLGLPELVIPEDNPVSRKKIELGKSSTVTAENVAFKKL